MLLTLWWNVTVYVFEVLKMSTSYLLSGSLLGLRWQIVASSITFFDAGPSRLFTASRTVFWDFIRSCIWDVRMNCRPQASRNLHSRRARLHLSHFWKDELLSCFFLKINKLFTCLPWRACELVVCSWTSARSWRGTPDRRQWSTGSTSG